MRILIKFLLLVVFLQGCHNLTHLVEGESYTGYKWGQRAEFEAREKEMKEKKLRAIIREEDNLTMVINIPANSLNISGTQFKINFDETRLEYIDAEYSNEAINSYDTKRTDYINIGSFSSDGSININSGIEYKLNFKLNASLKSTLGLLGIKFYELVTKEGSKVNLKIK